MLNIDQKVISKSFKLYFRIIIVEYIKLSTYYNDYTGIATGKISTWLWLINTYGCAYGWKWGNHEVGSLWKHLNQSRFSLKRRPCSLASPHLYFSPLITAHVYKLNFVPSRFLYYNPRRPFQRMIELLITFSVTFHPGGCVDGVTEQAVSRHLKTNHTGHTWSCKQTRVRPTTPTPILLSASHQINVRLATRHVV